MTATFRALCCLPILALAPAACYEPRAVLERRLERSFKVAPGSIVRVELAGGSVTTATGPAGTVHVVLRQVAYTTEGERAAESMLEGLNVSAVQEGDEVTLIARRKRMADWSWRLNHVRLMATVTVPADVRLALETSGGRIGIQGDRSAEVRAETSGGAIAADGGRAPFVLNTSGGSIKVARALGQLQAETSGGSVSVDYVGPSASDIDVETSGGSIRIGLDPQARLNITAGTSGGTVRIEGIPFAGSAERRSYASGTMNGGGGRLRASTSGGGITLRAADDPAMRSRGDDVEPKNPPVEPAARRQS